MLLYFRETLFQSSIIAQPVHYLQTNLLSRGERAVQCSEAVARRCSVKKVFLEILQISQENICAFFNEIAGLRLDFDYGLFTKLTRIIVARNF